MLMSVNVQGERHKGMETHWYIPAGKKLSETKIDERKIALHTTKEAWKNITGHLDRKRLQAEAIQKEIDHRNYIKEMSNAMTENWDNSVENIRKRKEEERIQRIEQSKEDKMQRFLMLRKEQEEIRQQYIKDKRKELYVMHGPPKELNSALILSEVIYEREKQIEMKDFLEQHRIEEEAKYAAKVKQGAIDEQREKQEEKDKKRLKKLETRRIYLEQIEENKKAAEAEREERIKQEIDDILAAGRETAQIKQNEIEEDLKKRKDIKKEFDDFYKRQIQYKLQLDKEEDEQAQVIELFANAKCRIEEMRKRKEEELQADKRRRAEEIAKKVAAIAASKQGEEERILREANEEKERLALEKIAERAEYDKRLFRERLENRQKVLEEQEKQKYVDEEMKKWIMLNRYKGNEVVKTKEEDKKRRRWEDILKYREELLTQIKERKQKKLEELRVVNCEFELENGKFKNDDDEFFKYAQEVTDQAVSRGRLLYPINKVIMKYKKDNNLVPSHKEKICSTRSRMKKGLVNCTPGKMAHDPRTDPNLKEKREAFKQFIYS